MGQELRQGMAKWFFTFMFQYNEVTWWYSADDWLVWRFQESFTHRSATLAGMPRQQGLMVFPARQFQDNQPFLHGGIELLRVCPKTSGWRLQNFLWRSQSSQNITSITYCLSNKSGHALTDSFRRESVLASSSCWCLSAVLDILWVVLVLFQSHGHLLSMCYHMICLLCMYIYI